MTDQREPDWSKAGCVGQPFDVFFPPSGSSAEKAKQICSACPIRLSCRAWAVDNHHLTTYGVWGGLTAFQRRRRARARTAGRNAVERTQRALNVGAA